MLEGRRGLYVTQDARNMKRKGRMIKVGIENELEPDGSVCVQSDSIVLQKVSVKQPSSGMLTFCYVF